MHDVSIAHYRSYHTEITQLLSLELKDCKNGTFFARAQNPVLLLPKDPHGELDDAENFTIYPIPVPFAHAMGAFM